MCVGSEVSVVLADVFHSFEFFVAGVVVCCSRLAKVVLVYLHLTVVLWSAILLRVCRCVVAHA